MVEEYSIRIVFGTLQSVYALWRASNDVHACEKKVLAAYEEPRPRLVFLRYHIHFLNILLLLRS